jgi:hypothetical protein
MAAFIHNGMAQVLKRVELGVLIIILLIGIIALATELTQYEEIAKVVVIPSLMLLIIVTLYELLKSSYLHV